MKSGIKTQKLLIVSTASLSKFPCLKPIFEFLRAKRKTNLGNVIGQRKSSYFFTVRANKFALWKMGFSLDFSKISPLNTSLLLL
jgi:hypothetical protein